MRPFQVPHKGHALPSPTYPFLSSITAVYIGRRMSESTTRFTSPFLSVLRVRTHSLDLIPNSSVSIGCIRTAEESRAGKEELNVKLTDEPGIIGIRKE